VLDCKCASNLRKSRHLLPHLSEPNDWGPVVPSEYTHSSPDSCLPPDGRRDIEVRQEERFGVRIEKISKVRVETL